MTNAWIIYKADSLSAPGWEDRALQPSGALTSILAEEHDYSGTLPTIGERVREYTNLETPGDGVTHGRDGDWVVADVNTFDSPATDLTIVVCICKFEPSTEHWQPVKRGEPISEAALAR